MGRKRAASERATPDRTKRKPALSKKPRPSKKIALKFRYTIVGDTIMMSKRQWRLIVSFLRKNGLDVVETKWE